jgi:hypothetical protein
MLWPIFLLVPLCTTAHPLLPKSASSLPTIRPLVQFPNLTWVENIAVRPNGKLLVTLFTSPDLYQIDPFAKPPSPQLVATFPSALGILGITEIADDVWAITKGNFSSVTGVAAPASFSVWQADFSTCSKPDDAPQLSRIADNPAATMLNGATTVAGKGSRYLLFADSLAGVLWRLDLKTAKFDVVLNDTATQPDATFGAFGFGANGVHTRDGDGYLYFTNTNLGFFRVPIHDDGLPSGKPQLLANFTFGDDFAFDPRGGDAIIARGRNDAIAKLAMDDARLTTLAYKNADADVLIEGNTAVAFGRTRRDRSTVYVTTNGGMTDSGLVPGTPVVGGRVLAIDLE